jgi:hypothetical protein
MPRPEAGFARREPAAASGAGMAEEGSRGNHGFPRSGEVCFGGTARRQTASVNSSEGAART